MLGGNDCYALRCAYLHEGADDISKQRAREAVDKFLFIVAPSGLTIHCNMINNRLQLQVDIFCADIKDGVVNWLSDIAGDSDKVAETAKLLKIQLPDPNGGILI